MKDDDIPTRSHVLLDTNILIDALKHPKDFAVFFAYLQKKEAAAVLEEVIQLEFLRGIRDKKVGQELLSGLFGDDYITLSPSKDIFTRALHIADMYLRSDNKQVSLPDTLIAGQMCRYAREQASEYELLLATQNHRDFPPILFNRVAVFCVTLRDGSIKTIGFYRFEIKRYQQLCRK
jgi:predicted nucleic acid-binding protein